MIVISIFTKKNKKNYLDFIPERNSNMLWKSDNDIVTIIVHRKGFFDKIAQKVFKKPEKSYIKLDQKSSYIWFLIDGNRTVEDIAILFKEKFKQDAEPLYERIVKFFIILYDNKFISYKK